MGKKEVMMTNRGKRKVKVREKRFKKKKFE